MNLLMKYNDEMMHRVQSVEVKIDIHFHFPLLGHISTWFKVLMLTLSLMVHKLSELIEDD